MCTDLMKADGDASLPATDGIFTFYEKNVDEEDCVTGYELFEMVDVKADSEEGLSKVMGTYHRRIRLNV